MSEAIQDARRWLANFDSLPDNQPLDILSVEAASYVRALLQEMALMGRRPAEAGYDWLMANVDAQVSQAIEARNEHRHSDEDVHLRVASVRSNQAVAAALRDGAIRKPDECRHGVELVDGVIEEMSAATDGDGIRLVITGEVLGRVDIVNTMSVMIHEKP